MGKFLTNKQRSELMAELRPKRQRRNADRIRIILLLDQDWRYQKIAEAFFIDEDTIAEYRKLQGKIYFGDSLHPQYNLVLGYGWIKKGLEKEVLTTPGRLHLNISGALCINDQDINTRTFKTINAQSTCAMLRALREKNPDEKKILYILDNARYHHAKVVKALAAELEITLVYLPGYSPNLNPIERLWKFFKKKVLYNTCYPSFEEFKAAVRELFRGIRRHCRERETLLTDNFTSIGV
jgi:transposase